MISGSDSVFQSAAMPPLCAHSSRELLSSSSTLVERIMHECVKGRTVEGLPASHIDIANRATRKELQERGLINSRWSNSTRECPWREGARAQRARAHKESVQFEWMRQTSQ